MIEQEQNSSEDFNYKKLEKEELISRFIFSSRHCSGGRAKYPAFLPPKDSLEISVYRIQGLSENEIWEIDDKYVSGLRGKQSHGRADLNSNVINELNLTIDPNGMPHPRHANVYFSEGMTEDNQKLIALKLAEASFFTPRKARESTSSNQDSSNITKPDSINVEMKQRVQNESK